MITSDNLTPERKNVVTDAKTARRKLHKFGTRELLFAALWALVIAGIGNIGLRYLVVHHAPEWEARFLWLVVTAAVALLPIAAMLLVPVWVMKTMRKREGYDNDL